MTRRGADAGLTDAPQEHRVRTWAGRAPGPVSLPVTPGLEPPERTIVPCLGLLFTAVSCVPAAATGALVTWRIWGLLETSTGIGALGHSGQATWCYAAC